MKAFFFIFLFTGLQGIAQKVPQQVNTWYKFWGVNNDSIQQLPRIAPQTRYQDTGDIYYNRSDKKIHWRTENRDTTFVQQNLDSLRAIMRNSFQNDTDIVMMGGTVRQIGSAPNTWAWVSQLTPDHYTLGFDSLVVHNLATGGFTILYPHQARPITLLVGPDESLVQSGWQSGASVGNDSASIFLTRMVFTGGDVWWDNAVPNRIDIYGMNGFTAVTYDTVSGEFTAELVHTIPTFLSARPSMAVSITDASTNNSLYNVIDGQATLSDANVYRVHWYAYDRSTNVKITGTQPLKPVAQLTGPSYFSPDPDKFTGGSGNWWIFGIFRKYQ